LLALAGAAALAPVAIHVDHGLRDGSAAEAGLVAALARRLGTAFAAETVAVAPGANVEARARDARYAALERARRRVGATMVLVGHTADDLAETVLMNVVRGSAATGLAGMPVSRDRLVRPMLGLRRADTETLCEALGLDVVADPSNDDLRFRRNWVRHELMPWLGAALERDLVPVLARQAAVLREESDYLDALARTAWPGDGGADAKRLAAMPTVLARRALRQWLGPPPPSFDVVARVLEVARGDRRGAQIGGGRAVRRRGGVLRIGAVDQHDSRPAR
jgi:tRNA(Ile)-lysidine synthase